MISLMEITNVYCKQNKNTDNKRFKQFKHAERRRNHAERSFQAYQNEATAKQAIVEKTRQNVTLKIKGRHRRARRGRVLSGYR